MIAGARDTPRLAYHSTQSNLLLSSSRTRHNHILQGARYMYVRIISVVFSNDLDFQSLGTRSSLHSWRQVTCHVVKPKKVDAETGFLTFFPVTTRHSSSQCTRMISPLITEKPDRDITHPENDRTQQERENKKAPDKSFLIRHR